VKKLYIGNLPYSMTENDLRELFEEFGPVHAVELIIDHYTGKKRGFGFVTMENWEQAMENLNGREVHGRSIRVNPARDLESRTRRKFWQKG